MLRRALHPSASLISRALGASRASQCLFANKTPIIPINFSFNQLKPFLEVTDFYAYRKQHPEIPLDALQVKADNLHGWPFYKLKVPRAMILSTDLSATLADKFGLAVSITLTELFNKHGIDVTSDQIGVDIGSNKKFHIKSLVLMVLNQWTYYSGRKFTDKEIDQLVDQLHEEFKPLMIENLKKYASLLPGMRETLCEMVQDYALEIAATSGFNREEADVIIDEARKEMYGRSVPIGFTVTGSEAPSRPAPDMLYQTLADYAKRWHILLDPSSLIAVGDTDNDGKAAKNAGAWSIIQAGYSSGLKISSIAESMDPELVAKRRQQLWEHHLEGNRVDYVTMFPGDLRVVVAHINERLAKNEIPGDRPTYGVLNGKIHSLHDNQKYHLNIR